jgi:SHS2 domain-containing protein
MGYEELHHTADWAIRVWAADLPGLFAEAARAMHALSGVNLQPGPPIKRSVRGQAADLESLLVSFLSELLYRAEHDHIGYTSLSVQISNAATGCAFEAEVDEAPILSVDKQIKAVTFHNLHVVHIEHGWEVEIVFDV